MTRSSALTGGRLVCQIGNLVPGVCLARRAEVAFPKAAACDRPDRVKTGSTCQSVSRRPWADLKAVEIVAA